MNKKQPLILMGSLFYGFALLLLLSLIPAQAKEPTVVPPKQTAGTIRLNFQNAPLSDVLLYLSESAGFVVVQEVTINDSVNVFSAQPVTPDEAIDLLNAVLIEKGYVAVRNGRILKIVSRKSAPKNNIPVKAGSDPAQIPRKDEMVTQVMPLHFVDSTKLLENLKPLLSDDANISSNESSNSIVLTDTQTNVRRIAEIIQALDTTIAEVGEVRLFRLVHADALETADILNQLYGEESLSKSAQGQNQNQNQGRGSFGNGWGRLFDHGKGNASAAETSTKAKGPLESRVSAAGDPRTNSLLVTATKEAMSSIASMIAQLDSTADKQQQIYIYQLKYADANNVAAILRNLFGQSSGQNGSQTQEAVGDQLSKRSVNGISNTSNSSNNNQQGTRR